VSSSVVLPARFNGPPDSANGGYTAGVLARVVAGSAEVTLRQPPPLDRALRIERQGARVLLVDGEVTLAEAVAAPVDIEVVPAVDVAAARVASRSSPYRDASRHAFPTCFACGPHRVAPDGLRVFAGRVEGTSSFAATWTPHDVTDEIVWAVLDCPSSAPIFLDEHHPPPHVLGRIAARVDAPPQPGVPHVVMSWPVRREGRKLFSGSAIHGPDGLCAVAATTWIQLRVEP
jgi:hypothetical protein